MDGSLRRAVALRLSQTWEEPVEVEGATAVSGGSIHRAFRVDLSGGRRVFVKASRGAPDAMFEREAEGLEALAAPGVLGVPGERLAGSSGAYSFLLLEWVEGGSPGPGFFERFGRALARLHRRTAELEDHGGRFGFPADNWIGATPQPNGWLPSWVEFWRRRRLGHQLRLARERGRSDPSLERLGNRLADGLERWIDLPSEPPCLLHGDLWSGNFLAGGGGEPVLIDPACYYGHREADLAMTRLFGGFPPAFYAAYEAEWPLPAGSGDRLAVYQLYHLLNHLNLFGGSYRGACLAALNRLVGD